MFYSVWNARNYSFCDLIDPCQILVIVLNMGICRPSFLHEGLARKTMEMHGDRTRAAQDINFVNYGEPKRKHTDM